MINFLTLNMKTKGILFKITVVLLVNIFLPRVSAATVVLKNGDTVTGDIVEKTDKKIKINFQGMDMTYYLDEVASVDGQPVSAPSAMAASSGFEKNPEQIFNEAAKAVVVINTRGDSGESLGSGFIVDKSGVIVTNFHVVSGALDIEVKMQDGRKLNVLGLVDYSPERDVCVLKVDADDLPVLSLGDSDSLRPGRKVLVIGAPLGLEYSISDGLFSASRYQGNQKALQFTAPISPGNSGGPLLDWSGKVIGVVTFLYAAGQNLNFAVPVNDVKKYLGSSIKMSWQDFAQNLSRSYGLAVQGEKAYYAGNKEMAANSCKQAIELDPENFKARNNLGVIYSELGRMDEAIAELKKCQKLDPKYTGSYINLGKIYADNGRLDEAIQEFQKLLAINPDDAMAHNNLGGVYGMKNMYDEAIIEVKQAINIDSNYASAYANLGTNYYYKQMYDQALEALNKSLALDENNPYAHYTSACIYYAGGQYEPAVRHFDEAVRLGYEPDAQMSQDINAVRGRVSIDYSAEINKLMIKAKSLKDSGDFEQAFALYSQAFDRCQDLNKKECFDIFGAALQQVVAGTFVYLKAEQYDKGFEYALKHINLMEKNGGPETVLRQYKQIYNPNEKELKGFIVHLSTGYWAAGLQYAAQKDRDNAWRCHDKIKDIDPDMAKNLMDYMQEKGLAQ